MSSTESSTLNQCRECGASLSLVDPDGFCPSCIIEGALRLGTRTLPPEIPGSDSDTEEIKVSIGAYDLLEEIGRGGMGVVYRARQRSLNRIVAVKMILSGQFAGRHEVLRFRAEAEMAAKLNHPNIVAVHESGEHEGQHYFCMDFVQGHSLSKIVRDGGPLPVRRAAGYAKTIAEAIHYAHRQGVLHRDLKPSNVLIDAEDRPRITDFGLARHLRGDFGLTITGQLLGSPSFMPPEQAVGSSSRRAARTARCEDLEASEESARPDPEIHLEAASEDASKELSAPVKSAPTNDVYGIGAILYHSLTGRPPFQAATVHEVLLQLRETEPISPRRLNVSVPSDLETICLKCLEKEPRRRYHTAKEVADELNRFLNNEPLAARAVSRLERAWRWCLRKPVVAGLIVALQLALAIGLGGIFWEWRRAVTGERNAGEHRYASDMNLVYQAWQGGDSRRAQDLLRAHIPKSGELDLRGFEWRYLWNLCLQQDSRSVLTNLENSISGVTCSANGKSFAVTAGNTLRVFELGSLRKTLELSDPRKTDRICQVAWSPTATNLLAAAHTSGLLTLWNSNTGETTALGDIPVTRTSENQIQRIAFSPDGKYLAVAFGPSVTNGIQVWDVGKKNMVWSARTDNAAITVAFTRDSAAVISGGGQSGNAIMWDASNGKELIRFAPLHTSSLRAVALSNDGRTLATAGADNQIILWDLATRQPKANLESLGVLIIAFSPDSRRIASGGDDGLIRVWDVDAQKPKLLRGHSKGVWTLAFSSDGNQLVSGGADQTVRLWDLNPAVDPNVLLQQNRCISGVTFSPDGNRLATASWYRSWVELWDVPSRRWIKNLTGHTDYALCAAFSPDGKWLASGSSDTTVRLWRADTLELAGVLTNPLPPMPIGFSPDSKTLALVNFTFSPPDGRKRLWFWDIASRQQIDPVPSAAVNAASVAFSSKGRFLSVGYLDGWVRVWDFRTGRKLKEFSVGWQDIRSITFSLDDRRLAFGAGEKVFVYDIASERIVAELQAHTGDTWAVAFAPDAKTMASCGNDGTVKFWHLATLELALTLQQETGPVYGLSFSRDGNLLASGGSDGDVHLWTAPSWQAIGHIESQNR